MAEHKREMDIAAQLRLTAEHSRSKGPLLREAAEVIEALTFRLAEQTEHADRLIRMIAQLARLAYPEDEPINPPDADMPPSLG